MQVKLDQYISRLIYISQYNSYHIGYSSLINIGQQKHTQIQPCMHSEQMQSDYDDCTSAFMHLKECSACVCTW